MVNQREQKASYRTQLCIQIPAVVCPEIHAEIGNGAANIQGAPTTPFQT